MASFQIVMISEGNFLIFIFSGIIGLSLFFADLNQSNPSVNTLRCKWVNIRQRCLFILKKFLDFTAVQCILKAGCLNTFYNKGQRTEIAIRESDLNDNKYLGWFLSTGERRDLS